MRFVLTLVAGSGTPGLPAEILDSCRDTLRAADAEPGERHWLDPERACDLEFEGGEPGRAEAAVRGALAGRPVDLAVLPAAGRRKRLLVADMDATIVVGETLDELATHAGLAERIAGITQRAMAGELDFAGALRARVGLLSGLPERAITKTLAGLQLSPGARTLVQTMRAQGARTILVSGGFTQFTERVRELAGFDAARGNRLVIRDGRLSGEVEEPILGRDAKLTLLRDQAHELGLGLEAACAVGDGANDLEMVKAAGLGVAFRGKPMLRAVAGARVDHADLTALLYFQGYASTEFTG